MPEQLDARVLERRAVLERFVAEELRELEVEAARADEPSLRRLRARVASRSAELGLFGLTQPREVGGSQATALETVVMRETLARANVPLLASAVFGGGAGPLTGATGQLRSRYLLPTLTGQLRGSFGFTEPGGDVPRTVAIKDGEDLVLTGHKSFVTGGDGASWCAVMARLREADGETKAGTALVIVDLLAPDGLSRPEGVHIDRVFRSLDGGASHAYLRFDRVRVPRWHTLGAGAGRPGRGLQAALRQIGDVRLALSATAVGSALWVLDYLREEVLQRPRKGGALGEKESVRLRHADMVVQVLAARAALYRVARLVTAAAAADAVDEGAGDAGPGEGEDDPLHRYRSEVAALKVLATEVAGKVADEAIQLVGGAALVQGHPLEALYRRVRAWRLVEGANDVLRLQLSVQVLAGEARL